MYLVKYNPTGKVTNGAGLRMNHIEEKLNQL